MAAPWSAASCSWLEVGGSVGCRACWEVLSIILSIKIDEYLVGFRWAGPERGERGGAKPNQIVMVGVLSNQKMTRSYFV